VNDELSARANLVSMGLRREVDAYYTAQQAGFAGGMVKVHVTIPKDPLVPRQMAGESLWATPTDVPNEFVIDNIPFFATVPSFGDVVRAHRTAPNFYEFDAVVRRSDWQLARVIATVALLDIKKKFDSTQVRLERGYDLGEDRALWSLAVQKSVQEPVEDWLADINRNISWEFVG
jgi:hypothetical protein